MIKSVPMKQLIAVVEDFGILSMASKCPVLYKCCKINVCLLIL